MSERVKKERICAHTNKPLTECNNFEEVSVRPSSYCDSLENFAEECGDCGMPRFGTRENKKGDL